MFYAFEGEVVGIFSNYISLKISSGICFLLYVCDTSKFSLNEKVFLYVFDFIKDDLIKLFAFRKEKELEVFKELIEINGIGPKTALQILKNIEVDLLIEFINAGDTQKLKKIGGIGNKAERIIYELKNKLPDSNNYSPEFKEIYDVLLKLGYKSDDIRLVLSKYDDFDDKSRIIFDSVNKLKNE